MLHILHIKLTYLLDFVLFSSGGTVLAYNRLKIF